MRSGRPAAKLTDTDGLPEVGSVAVVEPQDRSGPTRVGSNRGRTFPPEVLTHEEVHRLMEACSDRFPTGIRNRALIVTLYRSGLRISEALSLMPKDTDLVQGEIRVLHGKNNKARTVGIDRKASEYIKEWLEVRRKLGIEDRAPLFCTSRGTKVNSSYVRQLLPRLARKAGILKRVHPHGFRHTLASELVREGVPLTTIQAQLGHSSAATTDNYLKRIAPGELIATIRKREW